MKPLLLVLTILILAVSGFSLLSGNLAYAKDSELVIDFEMDADYAQFITEYRLLVERVPGSGTVGLEVYTTEDGSVYHDDAETVTGIINYTDLVDQRVYFQVHSGAVNHVIIDDIVIKEIYRGGTVSGSGSVVSAARSLEDLRITNEQERI